jgi:GT2 family glycosyltransferase
MAIPVGIVTFNGLDVLKKCLDTWICDDRYELYIYDNGSDRETVEWLDNELVRHHRFVWLEKSPVNKGTYFARNRLIESMMKRTNSNLFVLMDSDIEFFPHSIDLMRDAILQRDDIGMVGFNESNMGFEINVEGFVEELTGECIMYRRELFQEIGGFNELLTYYSGDSHFCTKANMHGWKIRPILKDGYIHHKHTSHTNKGVLDIRAKDVDHWKSIDSHMEKYWANRLVCGKGHFQKTAHQKKLATKICNLAKVMNELIS